MRGGSPGASFAVGNFIKSTTAPPTDQSVTGVGFQPTGVWLFCTYQTGDGWTTHHVMGYGFSDGTNDRCVSTSSIDGLGTTDVRSQQKSKLLSVLHKPTLLWGVQFECDLKSLDADGFTVTWTTNGGGGQKIYYVAFGGDIECSVGDWQIATSTGSQSVTGVGFRPTGAVFLGAALGTWNSDSSANGRIMIGAAASSSQEGVMEVCDVGGQDTSEANRHQRTDACITHMNSGAKPGENWRADFTSFDSDGFTLNWSAAAAGTVREAYFAVKGCSFWVGSDTQKTSTGDQGKTGVGFAPVGVVFWGFDRTSSGSIVAEARHFLGASDGTNEGAAWGGSTDNVGTSECDMAQTSSHCAVHIDAGSPSAWAAAGNIDAANGSLDSDGYTINWSIADGTARQFLALAIGDAPAAGGSLPFRRPTDRYMHNLVR